MVMVPATILPREQPGTGAVAAGENRRFYVSLLRIQLYVTSFFSKTDRNDTPWESDK
jgi:hypothetical protein